MITALVLALVLGFVSGLRVFTAPAAVLLVRGGVWAIILTLAAIFEYVVDLLPKTAPRTAPPQVLARIISGAFSGSMIGTMHGAPAVASGIVGIIGALIGTYGGVRVRYALIARLGSVPAGITEDIIAIVIAAIVVTR